MTNRQGRIERIHTIRQWGTTEDAENMALGILLALPEDFDRLGIFATGLDDDNMEIGDGGISFQAVTDTSVVIVEITASGDIGECYRVAENVYSETTLKTPVEAAAYLIGEAS